MVLQNRGADAPCTYMEERNQSEIAIKNFFEYDIANIGLYYAEPLQDKDVKVKLSDMKTDEWKAIGADASAAFDGKTETAWTADGLTALVVDMGQTENITGFCYAPIEAEDLSGTIYKYNFYISTDGENWTRCETNGEFSNIKHNPIPYYVRFGRTYNARYFKLEPISEINAAQKTTIGDIGILL